MLQSRLWIVITIITILCFSSLRIKAQETLSKGFIDSTVIELGNLMHDYYIIKDKGEEAARILNRNLKKKKYYAMNGGVLANILVEDLQTITSDKHLMIKFYPEGDAPKDNLVEEEDDYKPSELALKRARFNNYGFKEVSILDMNIGYLKLDGFYDIRNSETTAVATNAINFLAHTNGIIIDLSENSGGDPATLQFLISYFFNIEPATHYNTFHIRDKSDSYLEERTLPYVPGKRLSKMPLYVITSDRTFSAGEALAYALKHLDRATIIGKTTRGGAHAADFKYINDYFDMSIPMARSINPITKSNWEVVGVKPDVEMEISKAKEFAHIELLKAAMKREKDEIFLHSYEWKLEEMESSLMDFSYKEISSLDKYVGSFDGDRKVYIEDGKLKYQKDKGEISTLTPINNTSFKSDTFSHIRIKFDFDDGTLIGLKFYLESGQFYLAKKLD